jgi:hypothetical protein
VRTSLLFENDMIPELIIGSYFWTIGFTECKVEYEQVEAMTVYNRVVAAESGSAVGKLSGVPFFYILLGWAYGRPKVGVFS